MNRQGTHLGIYNLSGATNYDWEDIAIGPGPVGGVEAQKRFEARQFVFNAYLVPYLNFAGGATDVFTAASLDFLGHLLRTCRELLGRPATNRIAQQFEDAFPVKLDDDNKLTWQGTTYDQPTQGAVQIIRHPLDPKRLIMLCAGLSGEATLRISESYLHDAQSSYAIFDCKQLVSGEWFDYDKLLVFGDWEADSDLVWKFEAHAVDQKP